MKIKPVAEDVYWIGVNDRETELFESLWPLPHGISYNSYLIVDEKVALIDTVKINYSDEFLENIQEILQGKTIDYLIINHMEPDHSGAIKNLTRAYPDLKIVGNDKTADFLRGFYDLENLRIVDNGEILDLGRHQLQFHLTPMLHWPETMMTFDKTSSILFSGDAFGTFGALDGGVFDDQVNLEFYEGEGRRYFSNILGKYSTIVNNTLPQLSQLDFKIIASTHGPVWRQNPEFIVDKYKRWSQHQVEKGAVIVYGSMYGNTRRLAEEIGSELAEAGVENIKIYDAARTDNSYLLSKVWQYQGLIIGSCTYNNKLFPPVLNFVEALENRGLNNRILGVFGSYSWSGGALSRLQKFSETVDLETIKPLIQNQYSPHQKQYEQCRELAQKFAEKLG